jgi:hypothetical protein
VQSPSATQPTNSVWRTADGGYLTYYAVSSVSNILVSGAMGLNKSELIGPLCTNLMGAGDQNLTSSGTASAQTSFENNYRITGYPYIAPKLGQVPLPFVSTSKLSFDVSASTVEMGSLTYTAGRPLYRVLPIGTVTGGSFNVNGSTMNVLTTNGAIKGTLTTTPKTGGPTNSRSFSGVLLQGGTQNAAIITADGVPVLFY